eukprot:3690348-Pyramimonas_sp.AAC.1
MVEISTAEVLRQIDVHVPRVGGPQQMPDFPAPRGQVRLRDPHDVGERPDRWHRWPTPEATIDEESEASEPQAQGVAHPHDAEADPELLRPTWRPFQQPYRIEPDVNSD